MDFQSSVPAFLLLGSAVVTIVMKMRPDQGASDDQVSKNRWVIGFSLAIISAVSTFIISQTGNPGSIVSEDQYMLAMLITTVFLLIYYVCTGGSGSDSSMFGPPQQQQQQPLAMTSPMQMPPDSTATCCGGDSRNQMINADCPPYIAPPAPYPPCIDNVYNENCYSKPFIPEGAVPCVNTDERRMKIRWDRRIDCPKHREMILKGDYPWAPGTPNWQNRSYVDANANVWYGPDPGYAPTRDRNRNIQGRLLPKTDTWGRGQRLAAATGEVGGGSMGGTPFMDSNSVNASPIRLQRKKPKAQQQFFWGQPPPKPPRFNAPDISYIPQTYQPPEMNVEQDQTGFPATADGTAPDSRANPETLATYDGGRGCCFAKMPDVGPMPQPQQWYDLPCTCGMDDADGAASPEDGERDVVATNWRIIMSCALVLIFHRCYRNVLNIAKSQGTGRSSKSMDPFQLVGQNPSVLADAIKQDATMMVILLSVACCIMFITMTRSYNADKRDSRRSPFAYRAGSHVPALT